MTAPIGFLVLVHMKTESPNRIRGTTMGARMAHAAKTGAQRDKARSEVLAALGARKLKAEDFWPVHVELTRISAGALDGDNLQSAFKATRDGVAKALGFKNDSDPKIRFSYRQKRGPRGRHAVEILVQRDA